MYEWLLTALKQAFREERLLKRSPRGSVHLLRHEAGGQRFVLRRFTGNAEVYRRLLHCTCRNLPAVYEVASQGEENLVLEEYIQGREIQVAVLEDRALPSIEIIPKQGFYDYENKYQPGAATEVCPAEIPPEAEARLREAAVQVYETLGLSVYSRADFILDADGEPWFLEINTLPGMTPTSLVPQEAAAVGIGYEELCQRIVEASLKARREGR